MAKYIGYMPVLGTIGNLTFSKGEDGEVRVAQKSTLTKEQILHDPSFKRTRETIAEFTRAQKSAAFILRTFREAVLSRPDRRCISRIIGVLMGVIHSDQSHPRGERTVLAGDINLLNNFEFNKNSLVASKFWGAFNGAIDRVTGALSVTVPPYTPDEVVQLPEDATHYRFVAAGIELDLETETFVRDCTPSAWLPVTNTATSALTLTSNVTPASTLPLFLVFGD